jgi:uncharacterized protein (UPF0332 family)
MKNHTTKDYINYRIEKARETLTEVESHIKNKFWNTSINRMYYACFYAVIALLVKYGIETSSHKGVRLQFGQEFIKTGKIDKKFSLHFSDLFEKRHKGDYNDFYEYDEKTVNSLFPITIEFVNRIIEYIENEK